MYFNNIFYNSENLKQITKVEKYKKEDEIFLLPHKALDENLNQMYLDAFSNLKDVDDIIFISPLHNYNKYKNCLYTLSSTSFTLYEKEIQLKAVTDLTIDDSIKEEEFALELIYAYVANNCKNKIIKPIFTALENKEDIAELAKLIKNIYTENSAIIISANFTSFSSAKEANTHAINLLSSLSNKEPLLDKGNKNLISGSCYKILEALRISLNKDFEVKKIINNNSFVSSINCKNIGEIYHLYGTLK